MSKTHTEDWLPLLPRARAVLRDLHDELPGPPKADAHVFTNRDGGPWANNLLKRFKRCVANAGIEPGGVDIHALRYTFATNLLRAGADPKAAQQLTRHKSLSVLLEVYRYVAPRDKWTTIRLLDNRKPNGHKLGIESTSVTNGEP